MTSRRDAARRRQTRQVFAHEFVEHLPEVLEEGVLYISIRYATAAHNCFCGCGREVVTPLHPTKWRISFNGLSTSLSPSVGSWSLDCRSHYWLEDGRVCWAETFDDEQIRAVRRRDRRDEQRFYGGEAEPVDEAPVGVADPSTSALPKRSRWRRMLGWLGA